MAADSLIPCRGPSDAPCLWPALPPRPGSTALPVRLPVSGVSFQRGLAARVPRARHLSPSATLSGFTLRGLGGRLTLPRLRRARREASAPLPALPAPGEQQPARARPRSPVLGSRAPVPGVKAGETGPRRPGTTVREGWMMSCHSHVSSPHHCAWPWLRDRPPAPLLPAWRPVRCQSLWVLGAGVYSGDRAGETCPGTHADVPQEGRGGMCGRRGPRSLSFHWLTLLSRVRPPRPG